MTRRCAQCCCMTARWCRTCCAWRSWDPAIRPLPLVTYCGRAPCASPRCCAPPRPRRAWRLCWRWAWPRPWAACTRRSAAWRARLRWAKCSHSRPSSFPCCPWSGCRPRCAASWARAEAAVLSASTRGSACCAANPTCWSTCSRPWCRCCCRPMTSRSTAWCADAHCWAARAPCTARRKTTYALRCATCRCRPLWRVCFARAGARRSLGSAWRWGCART